MRLKTFLATYLLFVCIFFLSLGIVSVYMTTSQFRLLKEKSEAEFRTITASLAKDIAVLSGRDPAASDFENAVKSLVESYERYYQKNNITLRAENLSGEPAPDNITETELYFTKDGDAHTIRISGRLTGPFWYYRLDYTGDVTENIAQLIQIQNILLLLAVLFSFVTAFALYMILSGIFKPLGIFAGLARKIADGHYNERIPIQGKNELASMAADFNRMATEIENHIRLLEDEAIQKQQFVDSFAHEIRTPLTSVHGYAEYMQKARLSEEELIDAAQSIMNEAGYMRKISDSLLSLATLRQNHGRVQKIPLNTLFEDVAESLRRLPPGGVEIICDCQAESLTGQEDLLRSLLLNLGFNALKACPQSGGVIELGAKKEGARVILSVRDNGCGIPAESLSKITEPFYRVDKARSRETGGAGLGLSLCKQIAEAHNTEMKIVSAPEKGTTVEIIFTTL